MTELFKYGFMGFFVYTLLYVAAGGDSSKMGNMVAQFVDYSLDTSVAALVSLISV